MSLMTICGGTLPEGMSRDLIPPGMEDLGVEGLAKWARHTPCLFTIVDEEDEPKMVLELFSGFGRDIDLQELEHQRYVGPMLRLAGIRYVTVSPEEAGQLVSPDADFDIYEFLFSKVEEAGAVR